MCKNSYAILETSSCWYVTDYKNDRILASVGISALLEFWLHSVNHCSNYVGRCYVRGTDCFLFCFVVVFSVLHCNSESTVSECVLTGKLNTKDYNFGS
jgi:hypothetical protein